MTLPAMAALALDDETRQFGLLLHSVTDYAIYMLDADGYVRSWNPGGERIKGYQAHEIVGQHFSRFYTPEDVEAGLPACGLATAREQGRFAAEGWRVRKDGSRFLASVVIDPIQENGQVVGFAKITRDVTERYLAQQDLQQAQLALAHSQKMEAVCSLTLGLAHDFNNLLTVIVNSLDLIARRTQDESRIQHLVDTAVHACDRGSLLTRQLLTFGRGQALAPERCDVNALLAKSLDLYRRAAGPRVVLEARLEPGLPPVEVDVAQFEAAILNLVSNSRDAMPGGGRILLSSGLAFRADPGVAGATPCDHLCISVGDDGPGIPLEVQSRVFEPFFTTKPVGQGSGLGLSQVFGFAGQSNGFAELSSVPGQGTTVRVCLPAQSRGDE